MPDASVAAFHDTFTWLHDDAAAMTFVGTLGAVVSGQAGVEVVLAADCAETLFALSRARTAYVYCDDWARFGSEIDVAVVVVHNAPLRYTS